MEREDNISERVKGRQQQTFCVSQSLYARIEYRNFQFPGSWENFSMKYNEKDKKEKLIA